MNRILWAAFAGLLFGLGLAISGMTNPDKVLNFLDLTGQWDPSLALVMGGALVVSVSGFAWTRRRKRNASHGEVDALDASASLPVDARLLIGSALFGIGWGIAGYCPGPALANLLRGGEVLVFVAALLAGSQLAKLTNRRI